MRKTFINTLINEADKDDKVFLITADMGYNVLEPFQNKFPERFMNIGVAEQNAIGVAAGLALSGFRVYVYSIIPFITMRCFEQIRVDVAYMKTNVRLIGVGAGFTYGFAGATHHSIEDIAIMRSLPGMTVLCPGDNLEAEKLLIESVNYPGPIYMRIGKNKFDYIHDLSRANNIKIGEAAILQKGTKLAIISTSNTLGLAKEYCQQIKAVKGFEPYLISMHTVKPLDTKLLDQLIKENINLLTIEEHSIIGGLGSAIAEYLCDCQAQVKLKRLAIPDTYSHIVGSQDLLREKFSLSKRSIEDLV